MEIKNTLNPFDPYNQTKLTGAAQANQPTSRAAVNAPAPAKEGGDRVSLSPEGKLRTEAFTSAMGAPDVRAEKVAALKARVQSGEYEIDSKAIAAKLLREEPGLFRP
jgi:negative regulator of flagellin synthesis FlgM